MLHAVINFICKYTVRFISKQFGAWCRHYCFMKLIIKLQMSMRISTVRARHECVLVDLFWLCYVLRQRASRMKGQFGFCDLCVDPQDFDKEKLREIFSELYRVGYETVALNQTVEEEIFQSSKKKKKSESKGVQCFLPYPVDIQDLVEEFVGRLRIFSRLTFVYSDPAKTHMLGQSQSLKHYNLYAVVPKTQAAFQLNADIITLNTSCSGLKLSKKLYSQAIERGINFEIRYADLIKPATRKSTIYYSHFFYTFGKSKSVIMSSGARDTSDIRNPYDVINLGPLMGLDETKARASIVSQCRHLLLKAEGRRHGKAIFVNQLPNTNDDTDEDTSEDYSSTKKIRL
ncbi:ribonuclease P protein subunit p30 isoform X2 [Cephus cinctus]|uniref:Ribonuclease P protein subunit p30 isoform X2 n=1 Tax=Cephus cinctus TaxID=211228 RepID=A0AAJ7RTP4_CEPCN|nr:ribonuclease P protein subunit p30 isoform X2 [Cephus cinctus]